MLVCVTDSARRVRAREADNALHFAAGMHSAGRFLRGRFPAHRPLYRHPQACAAHDRGRRRHRNTSHRHGGLFLEEEQEVRISTVLFCQLDM